MNVDKIKVNGDPRVKYASTKVNGRTWCYLDAQPTSTPARGTIFLVHGWPDLSIAWRYQIPMLLDLKFRCIALDCTGYGRTGPSDNLSDYGFKAHADAIAGIAADIGAHQIILGGHDWGGAVVYRAAQWYPKLVSHVFSVCTPFMIAHEQYIDLESIVKGGLTNFGYQFQLGSEDHKVENVVNNEVMMRKFFKVVFGGRLSSGKPGLTPEHGLDLEALKSDEVSMTPLLSEEEFEFYVSEFLRNGLEGPCNWYRTRRLNFEQEKPLQNKDHVSQPTLFIQALQDNILTPELSKGMDERIPNLTRGEVPSSHWALWQTAAQTNNIINEWFQNVVLASKPTL
ncbi:epoxide hydrolase-like protein [Piedraia hortae CBS 480.64]|uniref:Epoxide hydrolase-like protein n=1 Tax=Piedraia hortae CBS 480.64 TaxID=1314780 RepID=A0A6A7BU13_9PEZI|nr:epoxide hydrolase-like protein [Piedraia hortae CBS 480.64]